MKGTGSVIVLVLIALVALAGCGASEEQAASTPTQIVSQEKEPVESEPVDSLKIGLMTIRTGPGASFGIPYDTGPQILASEINDAGGWEVGGKRYRIDLDIQDSKWEIPIILGIAEKWVNSDNLRFVITGGDPMIGAIDPLTTRHKVIHISTTWDLEPTKNPYTFGTVSTHAESAPIFFKALRDLEPDVNSIVYMAVNFRFDINGAEWTEEAAREAGYEWIETQLHDIATADFLPVATAAVGKNPDMILLGAVQANSPAIIRAIRELGYEGLLGTPLASPSTPLLLDAFKGEEEFLEGFYAMEEHYLDDPELDALLAEYERRAVGTGVPPSGLPAYYYTLMVLLQGLQDAGTIDDPDAIATGIENVRIPNKFFPGDPVMTMGGTQKLGQRHQLQAPMALNVIRGGEGVTLDTFIATVK